MLRSTLRAARAFGLLACLALVVLTPSALADDAGTLTAENAGNLWFVELASPPTADGTSLAKTRAEKAAFRSEAQANGVAFTERLAFDRLWNGLSIQASGKAASALAKLDSVKTIYPVETYRIPETASISPELSTALAMTGADVTQSELGFTGEGVKVAVMDTGVDYDHPDLGGCFGAGCRVAVGHDFVGDAFNAASTSKGYNPVPAPDADPDDCNGHGTHVAGIIGASGTAVGVAPGVTFGAYRVFGCEGSTTADIMIAAMEKALADGMDVLNMSIGSAFNTWDQYPTAAASNRMVAEGMIVVASIGNSGANGVYSAGAPGVGKDVIGVASFDNSHINALTFRTNPANTQMAYLQIGNSTEAPTSGTSPEVVYVGRGCPQAGPSWSLPAADPYLANPSGKVALMDRGVCTFEGKYQRAIDAGAVGVVIANNSAGLFSGGGIVDRGFFAVGISLADGNTLKSEIAAGPTTLTWTTDRVNAPNPTGGMISSFSSYGLGAELDLKPDIGAPGGLIRSTYPLEKGGYATISGTSMSSPHVAGAVALLLQAKPGTSAADVRMLLQNSADPRPLSIAPSLLEVVHRQGAGMVDIDDAILATTSISPSKLPLGEGTGGVRTLTIKNNGSSPETYTFGHQPAPSTFNNTNAPSFTTFAATATFSAPSLTLAPGASGTVNVTISIADATGSNVQYGGYVRATSGSGKTYRVPYAGFSGDYQSIRVLTPTASTFGPFPKMGRHVDYFDAGSDWLDSYASVPEGGVYTMQTATDPESGRPIMDIPYVLAHLEHQARKMEFTVLDAATGQPFTGNGANQRNPTFEVTEYLPRSGTATGFFAWGWDGTLKRAVPGSVGQVVNPVPDGNYKVKVSLLKALGDPANPAHWETWTSPMFTIDRP